MIIKKGDDSKSKILDVIKDDSLDDAKTRKALADAKSSQDQTVKTSGLEN